jgi:hypothetical protein
MSCSHAPDARGYIIVTRNLSGNPGRNKKMTVDHLTTILDGEAPSQYDQQHFKLTSWYVSILSTYSIYYSIVYKVACMNAAATYNAFLVFIGKYVRTRASSGRRRCRLSKFMAQGGGCHMHDE